ncbi:MAG: hypothetical protein HWQ36_26150 [Nostoc sp. NMS2]|uniref:hypothetical protein n=1 Tax=Nostoc sp. NMS2 TaxID=2815389 RepID=UPI0025DCFEDA|nr:hypothetical protein [Nostoc sp. NMS2]MBN3993870.1 hypothetical protein [Nostoc sp. NMS2]
MTNEESLYGRKLTGKWRNAFTDAQNYDYETIIRESFYVAHGRVISQIEGAGKFGKEAKTLLQACEVLVEQGELTAEFVDELKLRLLGLDLDGMLRAFQGTLVLADGAMRLSKMGDIRRQLDICKAFIVAVLKNSGDRVARELALSCIQQLKLDADLPIEQLQALIDEAQNDEAEESSETETQEGEDETVVIPESNSEEVQEDVLEGGAWDD